MKHTCPLTKNYEFRTLYSRGKSAATPLLVVYCRRTNRPGTRIGFTVGKKLGNAVTRNRVRRRLREIYRLAEERFLTGRDIVVVARSKSVDAGYWELQADFLRLCERLGLTKPPSGGAEKGKGQ